MKKIAYILLFFTVLSACKQSPEIIKPVFEDTKRTINPIFLPYFNTFLDEGKKRGVTFTTEEQTITIKFSNLPRTLANRAALTMYQLRSIDVDSTVWLSYPEPTKEWIMFHELGHLLLKRDHTSTQLPNGEYSSIMWTDDNNAAKCSAPLFTGNLRRIYYFDELFNQKTPAPTWATENTVWKESAQTTQTTVVGPNAWNKNTALDVLVNANPKLISYKMLPKGLSLVVEKNTSNTSLQVPLSTFFPVLNDVSLQNYEVRMQYKLYGRGFDLMWRANNNFENKYYLNCNNACGEPQFFGVGNIGGGFFYNKNLSQNLSGTNELILQNKDNYIMIWLNGQLLFQSDVAAATDPSILGMSLYFGASQYDFEFITVTKL